jgi:hypothetical protein
MSTRGKIAAVVAALIIAGAIVAVRTSKPRTIVLTGAVMLQDGDVRKQSPIEGVVVTAADDLGLTSSTSDFSGLFSLTLRPTVAPGQPVMLRFRHTKYRPLDLQVPAGSQLNIARMLPFDRETAPRPNQPDVVLNDLVVRYSVEDRTATNIGSGAKAFDVVNVGNVPCNGHSPCSPDGRWKATIGGVSLDAGAGNEFRDARLSCVAGPCPFTNIESDTYSKGGQTISASVRDWSDTTRFVLEAEVFRSQITNTVQNSYPTILGRRLNFTLPASAEGPCIQAEVNGTEIVFPLGPRASLSWANCEVLAAKDQTSAYRCELKPGFVFKDHSGE